MRKIFCPHCDGTNVHPGEDWILIILGLLALSTGAWCLVISFPGAYTADWATFQPLAHEDTYAPVVMIYGLLMFISGSKHWHLLICDDCGHSWNPHSTTFHF